MSEFTPPPFAMQLYAFVGGRLLLRSTHCIACDNLFRPFTSKFFFFFGGKKERKKNHDEIVVTIEAHSYPVVRMVTKE